MSCCIGVFWTFFAYKQKVYFWFGKWHLVDGQSQKNRFNSYAHNRFILPLEAVAEGQLLYLLAYSLVHTSSNANLTWTCCNNSVFETIFSRELSTTQPLRIIACEFMMLFFVLHSHLQEVWTGLYLVFLVCGVIANPTLISFSNGLMNGDPRIVCVLTIWSSSMVWISSTEAKILTPVSL